MLADPRSFLRRNRRNSRGSSEIAEFVPVLFVLFIVLLMPMLDLVTVFVAAAIQYVATNDFASKAAIQATYSGAISNMVQESAQFQYYGLAKYVHLNPQGGYMSCGNDLYVVATNVGNGAVTKTAANQPFNQAIDAQSNMYEISVTSIYSVSPLISMDRIPLLSSIPGLGFPYTLSFTANRPVEHPAGLASLPGNQNAGAGGVTPLPRVSSANATPTAATPGAGTWRTPNIFNLIAQAGQTVEQVNVVLVNANNPKWTNGGVTVATGDKIWIDTQAVGLWNANPGSDAELDANGMEAWSPQAPNATVPALGQSVLAGVVGNGTPFFLGDDKFNYPPSGSGNFSMIMNDSYYPDNTGAQWVRIVVTR